MAVSNRDRVGKALELLKDGLQPFVEREMKSVHGAAWEAAARTALRDVPAQRGRASQAIQWDTQALLTVMEAEWQRVFRKTLGKAERSLVVELRDIRNRWAHQEAFSSDDAYRALDSTNREGCAEC